MSGRRLFSFATEGAFFRPPGSLPLTLCREFTSFAFPICNYLRNLSQVSEKILAFLTKKEKFVACGLRTLVAKPLAQRSGSRSRRGRVKRIILILVVGLGVDFGYWADWVSGGVSQPIAFPHKTHLELNLPCTGCHQRAEKGAWPGDRRLRCVLLAMPEEIPKARRS